MNEDIFLKDKFDIFNNQASSGSSSGRLSVFYYVHPAPVIFWEFETPSRSDPTPEYTGEGKLKLPFIGNSFFMSEPWLGKLDGKPTHKITGNLLTGSTPRVVVGDQSLLSDAFTFHLPNAIFQQIGILKNSISKEISYHKSKSSEEFGGMFREGFVNTKIKGGITLKIHTPSESGDWLMASRSIGTYITTSSELHTAKAISIHDATQLLDDITYLLSFANGGFIAPLVVNIMQRDFEKIYPSVYSAYDIDPIEHITSTWFRNESDICNLLHCMPAFQKMLKNDEWKSSFHLILTWYFQAIQSRGVHRKGKSWPIVANALGAALEKLASIILVDEMKVIKGTDFNNSRKMSFENKIRKLLEVIGIHTIGPIYGKNDAISWFKEMRHSATHLKSIRTWSQEEVDVTLSNAIQWIEETLLWRLGYDGKYQDRSRGDRFSITPRYNTFLRDKTW